MKLIKPVPTEIEVDAIRLCVHVNYPEDIAPDFPGLSGESLSMTLDLDTGRIRDWPAGRVESLHLKVCDRGCYYLLSGREVVAEREQSYVPSCVPGQYGDYLIMQIAADGTVTNWRPNVDDVAHAFDLEPTLAGAL